MSTTVLACGLAFIAVALVVVAAGSQLLDRGGAVRRRTLGRLRELSGAADLPPADATPEADGGAGLGRMVAKLGTLVSDRERPRHAGLRDRLRYAGYPQASAVAYYVGLQVVAVAALTAAVGLGAAATGKVSWRGAALWGAGGGAVGFLLPGVVLGGRVKARQGTIRAAMPDALDVIVMCVEGGVSLNAAVNCVADEVRDVHPELGAEFLTVSREVQLGLSVGEAFGAFAARCGVPEVRELAAVLVQSERLGASVAKALRAHAEQARQERQAWTEEMANKAAVKIVFPTLLCIFPAMFIVLLGPASFQLSKMFAK